MFPGSRGSDVEMSYDAIYPRVVVSLSKLDICITKATHAFRQGAASLLHDNG